MKQTCFPYRMVFLTLPVAGLALMSVLSSPAAAQPSFLIGAGANAPFALSTTYEEELFRNLWPVGFQAGLTLRVPVTEWACLDPTVIYRLYPYGTFHQETFIGTTTLLSSSGQPMQQVSLAVGMRAQEPPGTRTVTGFAEVTAGCEFERYGQVTLSWQEQGGTQYTDQWPATYQSAWAFGVELGVLVRLSTDVFIQPSFLWHRSNKDRNYALVAVDLVYAIPL